MGLDAPWLEQQATQLSKAKRMVHGNDRKHLECECALGAKYAQAKALLGSQLLQTERLHQKLRHERNRRIHAERENFTSASRISSLETALSRSQPQYHCCACMNDPGQIEQRTHCIDRAVQAHTESWNHGVEIAPAEAALTSSSEKTTETTDEEAEYGVETCDECSVKLYDCIAQWSARASAVQPVITQLQQKLARANERIRYANE